MNDSFESPLDKIIREARERGAFDNLRGAGQPIRWEDESAQAEDQRLANRLLKNNGFVPEWIAALQELRGQYQAALGALGQSRQARALGRMSEAEWQEARRKFTEAARKINLNLVGANMRAPHERYHLPPFSTDPDAPTG